MSSATVQCRGRQSLDVTVPIKEACHSPNCTGSSSGSQGRTRIGRFCGWIAGDFHNTLVSSASRPT